MLYRLSVFRPHSSSDPLTRATFPPGEGIFPPRWGGGRFVNRPYGRIGKHEKVPVRLDGDF